MPYEIWWAFAVLAWAAVFLTVRLIRLHLDSKQRLAMREILHRERVLAIERGVPLPEIPLEEQALDRPERDRRTARILAILLIGLGSGATAGLYLATESDLHAVWSLGLIPIALGVACAVAAWTTRN